jgi:threonine dehydrogenase-like Zn-dependent dehydrogenase
VGVQRQGGMADLFTVAADRPHLLPDDLDDITAVVVEPLSTPAQGYGYGSDSHAWPSLSPSKFAKSP